MADSRLFQMLYLLLETGSMSAPELSKRLEVSVRTVYRYTDALSAAGIPVYAVQGKCGGIFIEKNFVLNRSLLSEQEQRQILMALQGLSATGAGQVEDTLHKLSGVFQKQNLNWIEIDFTGWNKRQTDAVFNLLKTAILQNRRVRFLYTGSSGETAERKAEPLRLVYRDRNWFFYGYCLLREDYRFFKLSRIENLTVSDENFIRSVSGSMLPQNTLEAQTVEVILKFSPQMLFRLYDEFRRESIQIQGDGLYVHAHMPQHESLYSYILSFGDAVEVLSPEPVRGELRRRTKNLWEKYNT